MYDIMVMEGENITTKGKTMKNTQQHKIVLKSSWFKKTKPDYRVVRKPVSKK